jgi:hypothetical protein
MKSADVLVGAQMVSMNTSCGRFVVLLLSKLAIEH